MRIVTVNEFRVEVALTEEELNSYAITYEQMDYGDADTRRVLWTLLSEIRRRGGADLDLSGKLLIEVRREPDGGCLVCFTSLPQKGGKSASVKQLVKTEAEPVILECVSLDDAVRAAVAGKTDCPAALYYSGGRYRLVFRPGAGEQAAVALRAAEFGELLAQPLLAAAVCAERWRCLAAENAAALLRRLA